MLAKKTTFIGDQIPKMNCFKFPWTCIIPFIHLEILYYAAAIQQTHDHKVFNSLQIPYCCKTSDKPSMQ